MSGNDEHDPLDSWLNQQVRPLPPPPGTFELITRRARRRKLRKLAVTVASAAAVAAAVAVAVPNVIALNVTSSHETGNPVAAGQAPSASGGTQSANGSAVPLPAPTTTSPSPLGQPSGPVPANFQPSSVTFVSPSVGWVIGQAGTPGNCANVNPDICTSIARTNDAGKTWQGGPAPSAAGPSGAQGVSGLRFLDGVNGWAFGPELWATHDAGRTWTKVDTHGQRVTDLETAGDRAYALFATCSGTNARSFAVNCTSFSLMTTIATGDDWVRVSAATSDLANGGSPASAVLALTGSDGYLLAPDGTLYSGPLGGAWQRAGTAPCEPGTPQADGLPGDVWLALVDSAHLAMNCQGRSATSPPEVYTSGDGGKTWQRSAAAWSGISDSGIVTSFAAAPNGTLVLATTHGLYVLPASSAAGGAAGSAAGSAAGGAAGGAQWKPAADLPSGGFSYVGMTTDSQGVALPADTSLHEIWMTFDGGLTWAPRTPITPGN
jgi:hypothetical protein